MNKKFTRISLLLVSMLSSPQVFSAPELVLSTGLDSHYITEGRDNLVDGGIYWANAVINQDALTAYTIVGRGTTSQYIEWNIGVEYLLQLEEYLEAYIGYQRLESHGSDTYGGEQIDHRASDNEFFTSLTYTKWAWITPAINYTYATLAAGYFVELSLHNHWQLSDSFRVSPYLSQGFDFQYASEAHDGANHLQLGIEAQYQLSHNIYVRAHLAHSVALEDIKAEANSNGDRGNLNQTYAGLHFSWVL